MLSLYFSMWTKNIDCCFNVKSTTISFIFTALQIRAHNSQNICCTNTKQRFLTLNKQMSPSVYSLFWLELLPKRFKCAYIFMRHTYHIFNLYYIFAEVVSFCSLGGWIILAVIKLYCAFTLVVAMKGPLTCEGTRQSVHAK